MSTTQPEPPLRDATPEEMRTLGHPLRLRILRLALDRPMTNKELARRVGRDPGTVLHHVRRLVDGGFLAAEPVRTGRRGAIERPYRATGKSWAVRMAPTAHHTAAVMEAVRAEVLEAGPDSAISTLRLGVRLRRGDLAELRRRIRALGDEFAQRDDPGGQPVGILAVIHRRRP
ncbi:MAG TPA: helix-turn-helix domain-containing protein [Candidatus Limnocylindria bacterium]|nr:helix-turn-helix domain-containing protein [Candidatus Limnocylindria bacterium]